SVTTTTTQAPSSTTVGTTTKPIETTTHQGTTAIAPITQTLPGSTTIYTTSATTQPATNTTIQVVTTKPPKIVTTGPTTTLTTTVVETTTSVPEITVTSQESTVATSTPSVTTTTTQAPSSTTVGTTTKPIETTTPEGTTVQVGTTTAPKTVTTGPTTTLTTTVVETTTSVPEITVTSQESTVVTSTPSVTTTTTQAPSSTTVGTTTKPIETTTPEGTTVQVGTTTAPKTVTTGPTTTLTTTVVETTTSVPEITVTSQESTVVTSKPFVTTTTTQAPSSTTVGTTAKSLETTTLEGTTVQVVTTKPPKIVTTGPTTTLTTTVVETTTSVPEITVTSQESTVVTSTPSVTTTTTQAPSSTTVGTTTKPVETTTPEGTTVQIGTTKPPKTVTTGPTTTSTTTVVETTTSVPEITVTNQTTASEAGFTTTTSGTTVGVITGHSQIPTVITKPSVFHTTEILATTVVTGTTARGTTAIGPVTQTLTGSTTVYTSIATTQPARSTVVSTSRFPTASTSCVCIVNGTSHRPGDLVYNVTDGFGWCFTAYCNASCKVQTKSSPCHPTPIPTTTAHSATTVFSTTTQATISSSIPLTTALPNSTSITSETTSTTLDCNDVYPPRKNGQSWTVNNCTTATCTNGKITEAKAVCPSSPIPICSNGRNVSKVYDDNGCCFHYECECVCSVWGGSHYITFDGTSYSFNENCSYHLVKEIISKYNLSIIVNNHYCDSSNSTFCPKALIVTYQSYKVVLTQSKTSGTEANVVYINQKRIYPAYSNADLRLTSTDMVITLEIEAINAKVIYRGSSFSIDLPYSLFEGNTEGQCGTCDNSQVNECRSPNGQVESCSESAGQWKVPGTSCVTPTSPPVTTSAPRTSSEPLHSTTEHVCQSDICDLLTSSVFASCNAVISPASFVKACLSDACNSGNNTCSSLESYATECSNAGVCVDWRNATNGLCEHKCPGNKVYMACGPSVEPTCSSRYNQKFQAYSNTSTQEGCFCPNGTILFNTVYDTCVTSCDCVGPDGTPREPGETWTSGCNICECNQDSMSVQCQPVQCPSVHSPNCSEPGQQLVNTTGSCCTTQSCECNVSLCPAPITCPLGFQLNVTANTTCCQSYECVPKGVCVYNMTEYKPGAKIPTSETPLEVPSVTGRTTALSLEQESAEATLKAPSNGSFTPGPCMDCSCGSDMDPTTSLNIITCKPVVCNTSCSEGYEYQTAAGKCCGACVQKSCIFTSGNLTVHVIEVNSTYVPPADKCVQYTCEKINGQLITKESKTTCPPFNPLDCEPGTESTDANGCCQTCKVQSVCEVQSKQTVIEVNGCKSTQAVNITSCAGHCGSSSVYSAAANTMIHQCECCQEASTRQMQVELTCSNGSKLQHTYTQVQTCSCSKAECGAGTTSKPQHRRRR
ncbi:intestinal mucin-like protein, partial [Acanthochromis polyacanthus]|uniref:intestinal mucin-like protein n=1 Tax=Acanthochromis polyacanthus TaxID=80966 RepID=UPI002234DC8B